MRYQKGRCPGCNHGRHPRPCKVPVTWWIRALLPGWIACECTYWDARWIEKESIEQVSVPVTQ